MGKKKRPEALMSPVSSQNDSSNLSTHAQPPDNDAKYDVLAGPCTDIGQARNNRVPSHQRSSSVDVPPPEQRGFTSSRNSAPGRRQDRIDDDASPKAKMWDPVKDCCDPNTIQAHPSGFFSAHHRSDEQNMDSTVSEAASTGLPMSYVKHRLHSDPSSSTAYQGQEEGVKYSQAQGDPQQFTNLAIPGAASTAQAPSHQPHHTASGNQESASMCLTPNLQSYAMPSKYQGTASTGSRPFERVHEYGQHQYSSHHRPGDANISTLPPQLEDSSEQDGQRPMESITSRAAQMGIQSYQAGNSQGHCQEDGQQLTGIDSRLHASIGAHGSAPIWRPLLQRTASLSTQKRPDSQQTDDLQCPDTSADMSQAWIRYAETYERQSNPREALHAYKQACILLQDGIIRSCMFEERLELNDARNNCQARIDVLLRESVANPLNTALGQHYQQEDEGLELGGGKPQYSLLEDYTLCRKETEDLSWQEIAELPMFKSRRKQRSLSQRRHTIGKMGPQYQEVEKPWTEEEDRKLCALGDAGKTLGDIHRKFRSRNAERCLNRYFHLKGRHTTGKKHIRTSRQARHAPALSAPYAQGTQHMHHSSNVSTHPTLRLRSSDSVIEPISRRPCTNVAPQPSHQASPISTQSTSSVDTRGDHTPEALPLSPSFTGTEAPIYSTALMSSTNAASTEPITAQTHVPVDPQLQGLAVPFSSFSIFQSGNGDPEHRPPSTSAQVMLTNNLGASFGNQSSLTAVDDEITDRMFAPERRRAETSSPSSTSATTSPTSSASPTSSSSSPETNPPLLENHDSSDSHRAAATGVRKPRRAAHPGTV